MTMPDLRSRLRDADRLPAPDLWADIEERLSEPAPSVVDLRSLPGGDPSRRRFHKVLTIAAAFLIVGLAFGWIFRSLTAPNRPAQTPAPTHTALDIYLVDPATGASRPILVAPGDQGAPELSPDGSRIVFQGEHGGVPQIYVMDGDGSNVQRLTNLDLGAVQPTWSPDGRRIAFAGADSNADVFTMDADGTHVERHTTGQEEEDWPDWSPDGTHLVYQTNIFGHPELAEIWVLRLSDDRATRLTRNRVDDAYPAWSPDGSRIAFDRPVVDGYDVWLMRPDGSDQHAVVHLPTNDGPPAWSPDGRWLAYESTPRRTGQPGNDDFDLAVMDVSTGMARIVMRGAQDPSWSEQGILVSHER